MMATGNTQVYQCKKVESRLLIYILQNMQPFVAAAVCLTQCTQTLLMSEVFM